MSSEAISAPVAAPGAATPHRGVAIWLFTVCLMLGLMVVVGGATRLTHSGLSITEWRPVTGAVPPLSDSAWQAEFEKYKQIPQYRLRNPGMTLAEFKAIYGWEWGHRLLGRLIGIVFLVPLLWFAVRRELSRGLLLRLGGVFTLGAAQGALGWWMVKSGLADRIDVSQYRLAAHLGLAFVIFGFTFWTALDCLTPRAASAAKGSRPAAAALVALVFFQVLLGALVAGLHAGFVYNTWPLMDGSLWPQGYWRLAPWYTNLGENQLSVQLDHRLGAYAIAIAVAALCILVRPKLTARARRALDVLALVVVLQIGLGIATLLATVPLSLGLLHQTGALLLFAAAINFAHAIFTKQQPSGSGTLVFS